MRNSFLPASFVALCFFSSSLLYAQQIGVTPMGASDAQTQQYVGKVHSVDIRKWRADFSRHVLKKGIQTHAEEYLFAENGSLLSVVVKGIDGQKESKTVFSYDDNDNKISATTYSASDELSFQTLFYYDSDGVLDSLSFTDASAVAISTTTVSATKTQTTTQESFKDGEEVSTSCLYDDNFRLISLTRNDGRNSHEYRFKLGRKGYPVKASVLSGNGSKRSMTYEYEFDSIGNWIKKTSVFSEGGGEIIERTITYY